MNRAIFLDRDGTINVKAREEEYILSKKEFKFLPGALEAISSLSQLYTHIVVVTNQQCVDKGLITKTNLYDIHRYMIKEIERKGGRIDGVYFCPHLEGTCKCRKPLPGMLNRAAIDFNLSLSNSWMIGDSPSDVLAGINAGCKTIYLGNNSSIATYNCKNLLEVSLKLSKP